MRLLLIHPAFPYRGKDLFPIGLGYLAAVAKGHAKISVIDDGVEAFDAEKVAKLKPDLVGITSTTPSFPRAIEIASTIKSLDIGAKIVMGGTHVTFAPEEALRGGVDVVIRGEGEETFLELLKGYELSKIKGISYNDDGFRHNSDRGLIENLDGMPFPAHEFFPLKKYGIMSIVTSRGCPYSCSYCSATRFWNNRVRFRSPSNVIEELSRIVELNFRMIRFMDSTFTLDKKRAIEICRGIVDNGLDIQWSCETRADHLTDDLLKALSSAGCELICVGVDSGSQTILDMNKRRMDVSSMKKAFEKAREYSIRTRAYVTFGLPGETIDSPRETIKLLEQVKPDQILLSLATAYPGTELWNGRFINVHPSWIAKFHGHGQGGRLYFPDGIDRKDYTKLADYMYKEVKRILSTQRAK